VEAGVMTMEFTQTGNVDNIELIGRGLQPSMYDDLIKSLAALNHKQTITVRVKPGNDPERSRLRIRQAINRYMPVEVREVKRFLVRKSGDLRSTIIIAILHSRDS
jgi:hypothetical protein